MKRLIPGRARAKQLYVVELATRVAQLEGNVTRLKADVTRLKSRNDSRNDSPIMFRRRIGIRGYGDE